MLKSRLTNLQECGIPAFEFAGIRFPKHLWTIDQRPISKRLESRKSSISSDYYHAPKPNSKGERGFHLDSDGQPFSRWTWCDDVDGVRINHEGWFADEFQDTKIRGIVVRLNGGRGFLAGWSMGEGMASTVDTSEVYEYEVDAAHAADSMAETTAETEREYQEDESERINREEQGEQERQQSAEESHAANRLIDIGRLSEKHGFDAVYSSTNRVELKTDHQIAFEGTVDECFEFLGCL